MLQARPLGSALLQAPPLTAGPAQPASQPAARGPSSPSPRLRRRRPCPRPRAGTPLSLATHPGSEATLWFGRILARTAHAVGYGVCCCSLRPQGLERAALAVNPNLGGLFQTRPGSRRPVTQPPLLGTPRTPSPAPRGPRRHAPAPPQGPGRRRRAGLAGARQDQTSRCWTGPKQTPHSDGRT